MSFSIYDLIRKPVITEKATMLSAFRQYVFQVAPFASKESVAKAVADIFAVKVKSVNIINVRGKVKKFKNVLGKRSDVKKAVVTLEKDFVIDFAGGIK